MYRQQQNLPEHCVRACFVDNLASSPFLKLEFLVPLGSQKLIVNSSSHYSERTCVAKGSMLDVAHHSIAA